MHVDKRSERLTYQGLFNASCQTCLRISSRWACWARRMWNWYKVTYLFAIYKENNLVTGRGRHFVTQTVGRKLQLTQRKNNNSLPQLCAKPHEVRRSLRSWEEKAKSERMFSFFVYQQQSQQPLPWAPTTNYVTKNVIKGLQESSTSNEFCVMGSNSRPQPGGVERLPSPTQWGRAKLHWKESPTLYKAIR